MKKLEGSYKAKRDDQTYTYEVRCCAIGHTALWEAKILLGDELVGMPSGEVLTPGGVDLTGAVRFEVESAIEHRLSVEYAEDALLGRSPRMQLAKERAAAAAAERVISAAQGKGAGPAGTKGAKAAR